MFWGLGPPFCSCVFKELVGVDGKEGGEAGEL